MFPLILLFFSALMASTVDASGIMLTNACDVPLYFVVTHSGLCEQGPLGCFNEGNPAHVLQPGGASHFHTFQSDGSGTAIKISHADGGSFYSAGVQQMEYTVNPAQGNLVYWDLSDIDGGHAFTESVLIEPRGEGAGVDTCQTVGCGEGPGCAAGYQFPTDDLKTHACAAGTDLYLTYCADVRGLGR